MTGMSSPRALFRAALLAGLIAGSAAAVFHVAVTERLIDRALEGEHAARHARGEKPATPIVSRMTQRSAL
jgi:hypothetical protein